MKQLILLSILSILWLTSSGQTESLFQEGTVSFISSKNVYVKFSSTKHLKVGDTIFVKDGNTMKASLVIENLSSMSSVCKPISNTMPELNDIVYSKALVKQIEKPLVEDTVPAIRDTITPIADIVVKDKSKKTTKSKEYIRGRLSASAMYYGTKESDFDLLKMRYVFSMKARNIRESKFSAESYISFAHKRNEWSDIQDNLYNGLKVYSLAAVYTPNDKTQITLGRKYNSHISSMGAIDGLQIQRKIGNFDLGIIAGTRPDHFDYSFNSSLVQYGAYLGYTQNTKGKRHQSSLAFVEQKNGKNTDRRFIYFQHNNTLLKNLYVFTSFEMNLYKVVNTKPENTFDLTSYYLRLRYRPFKKLTLTTSYDVRNNIVFYESYKNYLDRLLEQETRQGIRFRVHYKMFKNMYVSTQANYRFRTDDPKSTKNIALNLYFNRLFMDQFRMNISANYIDATYLRGTMASARLNYPIIPNKLRVGYQYRFFFGSYNVSDLKTTQHINEAQLNWDLQRKISLTMSYEATLENQKIASRAYLCLSKRF